MSAIAGILYFHGAPLPQGLIEKLTGAMKSSGPDEQTHWIQGTVALGHCMLRTTPESIEERQPLAIADRNLVLVWDGRLDNRGELRQNLIAAGAVLRDGTDAELVLQSYAVWGEASPEQLLGDFAFAVWDARRQTLFCARDHMGARPLYFIRSDHLFAFASEEEALLGLPGVTSRPDEEWIATLLWPTFHVEDGERSWLEDVHRLLPAKWLAVSAHGDVRSRIYWRMEPGEEAQYSSDEECREAFMAVFGEAVRNRMRSNGDIAAMMSGGLDSASIAAMAKRLLPEMPGKRFHTYSAISDHPETCIESRCILDLTKDLGNSAHAVYVPSFTGMLNVQDLIETAWSKPHPLDNSILLPAMMCLAASRDGQRVMLHGMGGDFTTYVQERHIAYLLRAGQWQNAIKECFAASRNNTFLMGASPSLLFMQNLWTAYVPPDVRRLLRWLRGLGPSKPTGQILIHPDFASKLEPVERARLKAKKADPAFANQQRAHIQVMQPPFGYILGLDAYNRVAGHYGVELRDPWSDRRVAEFWLHLPLKYKVGDGWTKYLVRKAFEDDLSPLVRWRKGKEHLGWNFASRLMDETHGFVERELDQDLESFWKYADRQAVGALATRYLKTRGYEDMQDLYKITSLALWLKRISC